MPQSSIESPLWASCCKSKKDYAQMGTKLTLSNLAMFAEKKNHPFLTMLLQWNN